jgi:TolB-like protein/DNA-binding winged helix-turn-helix (wHTH) protein/Tfp pilus assembly protein PilF
MAAAKSGISGFEFGVFELDLKTGELRKQGIKVKLQEQPLQVLAVLLENAGNLVPKDELRRQIWSADTFVDFDHGLHSAITRLREALGDSSESPRFIETLARRGYRFVAPVKVIGNAQQSGGASQHGVPAIPDRFSRFGWSVLAGLLGGALLIALILGFNIGGARRWLMRESNPTIRSLAVLPFANLSGGPAQEYFSDGMTDALITDLAQLGSVKVISRTSVMHYKKTEKSLPEVARELNVDGIVEGTVQRSGDRVRITAQLIHGPSDRHVWARSYERDLRDVLLLQEELGRAIAGEINIKVGQRQQVRLATSHVVNPQAYEVYLQGLAFSRQDGEQFKRTSVDYFNRAIQMDSGWALPYAQLARSYHWIAGSGGHAEFYPRSKSAALQAISIDDNLAEAHAALAFVLHNYDWDWSRAEQEYQRALDLNPNYSEAHHGYAELLTAAARNEEAVAEIQRAEELDPLFTPLRVNVGVVYSCVGRHDEAIEQLRNTTQLNPQYSYGRAELGMAYLRKGMYPEAVAPLEEAAALEKDDEDNVLTMSALAYAYALAGRKKEAMKMLHALEQVEAGGRIVAGGWDTGLYQVYFALGQKEQAFSWLEKAYKARSDSLLFLRCWPGFERMRADPHLADLVRRVGIPQ